MATMADTVKRIRQILGDDPWEDYLTEAIASAGDLTIKVANTTKWEVGAVGEFQDDGEQFRVTALTDATTLTVKRGHGGTTASASHALNVVILRDPFFPYIIISDTVTGVVNSLWPYAWKSATATAVTPSATKVWYALASVNDAVDLIDVAQYADSAAGVLDLRRYGTKDGLPVLFRGADGINATPSVRFPRGLHHISNTITVRVRAKLTTITDITAGLMHECVIYYAAARLVVMKEVPRLTQEDARQPDVQVPPGARLTAGASLGIQAQQLRHQLHDELLRTIPPMNYWR